MTLLTTKNIDYRYGETTVLSDVSFDVSVGEVVALIGPNGAGKSTMLSVIAGDLRPDRGAIRIQGRIPHAWAAMDLARHRSVLLQNSSVTFSYRVEDVVAMGRTPWKGTQQQDHDAAVIKQSMEITDTAKFSNRDVTTLSGGEGGRVQLARVLAQSTPLVLLDEPTAALDILHQESTLRTCRELAAAGSGVVVVLHDLDVAAAYADRVVLFRKGRVTASGCPEEVMTTERLSDVYGWPIEVLRHPRTGRLLVIPERQGHL
ncbi:heme ABC transporter ATP-binding protein [Rothia uropygialis]|uniref:heme ABC transporter ATP-binding protein n=1 Tax=Kocuria sp. 36 TaxID=1415402 RepID=UPI00101C4A06|nr:heme ABC transporter ATP-binding protein [Kocuria sp. 36]